jgi:S1-C subfamily serine protease
MRLRTGEPRPELGRARSCWPAWPAWWRKTVQLPDFTELVERVGPAVVNIRTLGARGPADGAIDPNIEEFFRRFGIPLPNRPAACPANRAAAATTSPSSVAWARASS